MAVPKVETQRSALQTCLWKAGLGPSRCAYHMKAGSEWSGYILQAEVQKREESLERERERERRRFSCLSNVYFAVIERSLEII